MTARRFGVIWRGHSGGVVVQKPQQRIKYCVPITCEAAVDLLLALNAAKSLRDLSPLSSIGLHKLKGDRRGKWAMTVNERWRICFEFRQGDAYDAELVDYHRG